MKGNVIDMAVGIVIGGAFGRIVTSLVNDLVMPPIGLLIGGVDFAELAWVLKEAEGEASAVAVNYGLFINTVLNFIIVALAIFMVIKAMNNLRKKQEAPPPAPVAPPPTPREQVLLEEIRDLLKK